MTVQVLPSSFLKAQQEASRRMRVGQLLYLRRYARSRDCRLLISKSAIFDKEGKCVLFWRPNDLNCLTLVLSQPIHFVECDLVAE